MSVAVDYFGRLHPLLIHFPIALLLVGALLEIVRWVKPDWVAARAISLLLGLGTIGALVAVATGWVFAEQTRQPADLRWALQWHRWLGVATAIVAFLAWAASNRWADANRSSLNWARRLVILGSAALVAASSHLGAILVWGDDYFEP